MAFEKRRYDVDLKATPDMGTEELLCSLLEQALDALEDTDRFDLELARSLLGSIRTRRQQAAGEIRMLFEARSRRT